MEIKTSKTSMTHRLSSAVSSSLKWGLDFSIAPFFHIAQLLAVARTGSSGNID